MKLKSNLLRNLLLAVLAFLSIASFSSFADEENKHFYFVQLADTHLGDADHMQRTQAAVNSINNLPMPIKFVGHTGDITMGKIDDEKVVQQSLSLFQQLSVPVHYISGNKDILKKKLKLTTKAYKENFGGLISMVEYEGVVFIFAYTEPLRKSFSVDGYEPLKAVEEYLKKAQGKPVVIFHHAPSVDKLKKNKLKPNWNKDVKDRWVKLINSYNVKAVIAGHFHKDEHHWLGDVPLYISAPIAGYKGRQPSYRLYEYRNGKIGYRTLFLK